MIVSQRKTVWCGFQIYHQSLCPNTLLFFLFLCVVEKCQKNKTSENRGMTRMYAHLLGRRGYRERSGMLYYALPCWPYQAQILWVLLKPECALGQANREVESKSGIKNGVTEALALWPWGEFFLPGASVPFSIQWSRCI